MKAFFLRHIDVNTAWKAALFLGLLVYAINFSHGAISAAPAALKQAIYTFFAAGFIVKLCENLAGKKSLGHFALPLAVIVPACIAISLTYLVHSMKGTPEPFQSTLPTMLLAPPSFFLWAWRSRKNPCSEN